MSPHVVVIGGGIAGLAAAARVNDLLPQAHVTLFEASGRLGGHVHTEMVDGFVMEAGPDMLLAAKPAAMQLCERLGIAGRMVATNAWARGSLVLRRGRLLPIPEGMSRLVPSQLRPLVMTSLLSPVGKLRVGMEWLLPARTDSEDESLEHFVVRRFGREMYERLLEPLLSGMVAGDGRELSAAATFPQLVELERAHGGLLRGVMARRRAGSAGAGAIAAGAPSGDSARPVSAFVSLRAGLGELVSALETRLATGTAADHCTVRRGTPVRYVTRDARDGRYTVRPARGEPVAADAVIVAAPAGAAGAMLERMDEELSTLLGSIAYAPAVTVSLGFPSSGVPPLPRGSGYTVPRGEHRDVLACTFSSAKFAERAPAEHALFRLFFGGAGRADALARSDGELTVLARSELHATLGITVPPLLVRIHRLPDALPQYTVGHLARLERVTRRLTAHPRVRLAGAAYGGVGVPDCVRSGEAAAHAVVAALADAAQESERVPSCAAVAPYLSPGVQR